MPMCMHVKTNEKNLYKHIYIVTREIKERMKENFQTW